MKPYNVSQMMRDGLCTEMVESPAMPHAGAVAIPGQPGYWRCGLKGATARHVKSADGHDLATLGRPVVIGGPYCHLHGGWERARGEANRDWNYLAPASVGNVEEAGSLALGTEHAYLVLRREADEIRPARYRIVLSPVQRETLRAAGERGGGSYEAILRAEIEARADHVRQAAGGDVIVEILLGGPAPRKRPWLAQLGLGSHLIHVGAYATREEALAAGLAEWRMRVSEWLGEIREARGGTLDWGVPVRPLAEPILVEPKPGQSAWDAIPAVGLSGEDRGLYLIGGVSSSGVQR